MKLSPTENQYKLILKEISRLDKNKIYKCLDVGAGDQIIKKHLPKNIVYNSLGFGSAYTFDFDLDAEKFPIKDKTYDLILCTENLEHVMYPQKVIDEIKRVAKQDAVFFFSMPNDYNFIARFYYLFAKKTFMEEPFMVVEKHLHIHRPRVKDILRLFSNNFKITEVEYLWQSRKSVSSGFARALDGFINFLAQLNPSFFARSVSLRAINK